MHKIPEKNTRIVHFLSFDILPALNNIYPITRLNKAHRTLIAGDDKPLPGGVEKGEGKGSPETP